MLGVTMGGGGPGHRGRHRGVVSRADQGHRAGHGRRRRGRVHPGWVVTPGHRDLGTPAGAGGAVLTHQGHKVREVVLAWASGAPGGAILVTILGATATARAGVVVRVGVVQVLGRQTCNTDKLVMMTYSKNIVRQTTKGVKKWGRCDKAPRARNKEMRGIMLRRFWFLKILWKDNKRFVVRPTQGRAVQSISGVSPH